MSNSQLLYEEECKIDNAVLHHQEIDGPDAKDRFKRTVMAVYEIVEQKLYKTRHNSLETYFRSVWRISRAQVYRFYNCARILKELAAFDLQPSRERLCRAIKKLAHSADDRRLLWKTVIEKTHEDESLISSTIIANVWKELVKQGLVSQQHPSYMINEEVIDGYSDKDHVEVATGNDGSVKSMPSTPTAARQDRELIGASNLAKVSSVQASLSGPGMLQIGTTHNQHAQQYLSSSPPRSQKRTHHAMNDHHQSVSQRDRFKIIAKAPDESIDLTGAQGGSLQDSNNSSSGWMKRDMDTIFSCLQRLQKNGVEMQAMGDSGQWIRNIQDVRFVQTSQQKNGAGDINIRPAQQPAQSNKLRYDSGSNGHQFNDYRGPKLPTIEGHKSPQRPLHYPAQSQIQQYNFGDFYQQIYPTSQYNAFRPADQFGSYPSRSVPFAHDKRPESGYMFQSQQSLPNQLSAPPPYQMAQNPYQQQQQDPRQQHQQQTLYQQNQQHFPEDAQLKSPHPASLQQQQQQQQQQSQQQQKSDIKFLLCQRLQSDADHQQL
ncbi:hypothetical protein MP228_001810 [Amoeboaphelidium protococcarum]|nr:hypothetical protein MP228_001810 [Amoeboaphelidium protococcarum]